MNSLTGYTTIDRLSVEQVLDLQLALRGVGSFDHRIDGIVGPLTRKAWTDWKRDNTADITEADYISKELYLLLQLNKQKLSINKFNSKEETIKSIKREAIKIGLALPTQQAYILATVHHETDNTFKAIEEYSRGKGRPYGRPDPITKQIYYGRGHVQLTHKYNYEKYAELLNADLVNHPELALYPDFSVFILVHGFKTGNFTGRKLETYVNKDLTDFIGARRCINGLDDAGLIANLAKQYLKTEF